MSNADSRLFTMDGHVAHERGLFNEHGYFDEANATLCRMVGERLTYYYPGHPWGVKSEIEHGVVKICVQGFSQWQYIVHVASLKGDPTMRKVFEGAGELLERLGMPRKGFSMADWLAAAKRFPAHFNRFTKAPV